MKPLSDATLAHLQKLGDWPELTGTRYTALEELDRGGMGAVYRAHDAVLGREVALKVLNAPDPAEGLARRLEQEARILARLEHPGIVPVHDLGVLPDGRVYYVMKLVRGRRLDQWISGDPSLRSRLDVLIRVAEAVGFAHARGVIHRDLKPANIMVGEFGEVLVLDWGVAKLVELAGEHPGEHPERAEVRPFLTASDRSPARPPDRLPGVSTSHGTVLGTRGFMAPEQERGQIELVDQRTDVHALGRLLQVVSGDQPPRRLRAIAERAAAPHRDDRYPSVAALARDVARFQDGLPVEAYRENLFERAGRLAEKYRTPLLLVLAYLLMRAVFIVLAG